MKLKDGRKQIFQWDEGVKLLVCDPAVSVVEFCHRFDPEPLAVDVADGEVQVPNILLQSRETILAYAIRTDADGTVTKTEHFLAVAPRMKPADYVYEETPVKRYQEAHPYLSLERLGSYLYEVTFDTIPEEAEAPEPPVGGGCSSFVEAGKLCRNLDWGYTELASFHVVCKGFDGMAFAPGLSDGGLTDDLIGQLPYRLSDGRNDSGIMVAEHVLFNDWNWHGTGSTPLYKLPYLILSRVRSMETLEDDLGDALGDLYASPVLEDEGYLAQFIVTDGETVCAILPPESESGAYVIADITENPKLTNFRWVEDTEVSREDLQERPTGVERWNSMPCPLSDLRFTAAYETPLRLSEFIGLRETTKDSSDTELEAIYEDARALYLRDLRDGLTWQTMHSVVYSGKGMESLWVQEDWEKDYKAAAGGSGGTADHRELTGRDAANQHPVSAITGLRAELDEISGAVSEKYSKPGTGIPATDLAEAVQESLEKADTALQEHQSLAGYASESWVEGKGYLTQHQSLAAYRTAAQQDVIDADKASTDDLAGKQDTISDLASIRSGAAAGATALQSVPSGYATESWVEGKGYLTQHQSLAAYRTAAAQDVIDAGKASTSDLAGKQDTITDLDTIREGAAAGATALQSVPSTYRTAAAQDVIDAGKQDTISDLASIRSGAEAGATAVQPGELADYQTAAISDAGGYYTTDTVEGALQEVGSVLDGLEAALDGINDRLEGTL